MSLTMYEHRKSDCEERFNYAIHFLLKVSVFIEKYKTENCLFCPIQAKVQILNPSPSDKKMNHDKYSRMRRATIEGSTMKEEDIN